MLPRTPFDIQCFVLWSLSLGGSLRDGHGTCGWGWKTCPRLSREASLLESWSINVNHCIPFISSFCFHILRMLREECCFQAPKDLHVQQQSMGCLGGLASGSMLISGGADYLTIGSTWVAYQQSTWNHGNHRNRSWIMCTKQELGETYHDSSFYQALRSCGTLGTVMVSLGLGMLRGSRDDFSLSGQDKKDMGWTAMNPTHITIITSFSWGRLQPSRLGQSLEDWLHGVSFSIQAPQIQERNVFSKITALGSPER